MSYSKKIDQYLVLVTATLFIVAFIGALIFLGSSKPQDFDLIDQPTLGNFESKVEMVVFEDLMCDDCKHFMLNIFPSIQEKYIKTNLISFKMIPIAFLPYSKEVTTVALCLYKQNKKLYWSFVQNWYTNIPTYKVDASLTSLLNALPVVDKTELASCRASDAIAAKLKTNLHIAEMLLTPQISVPSILINGKRVPLSSIENISKEIDLALSESNKP